MYVFGIDVPLVEIILAIGLISILILIEILIIIIYSNYQLKHAREILRYAEETTGISFEKYKEIKRKEKAEKEKKVKEKEGIKQRKNVFSVLNLFKRKKITSKDLEEKYNKLLELLKLAKRKKLDIENEELKILNVRADLSYAKLQNHREIKKIYKNLNNLEKILKKKLKKAKVI